MRKLSGILCLLLIFSAYLQAQETKLIINEDFHNNDNNWPVLSDSTTKTILERGGYIIRSFTDNGSFITKETDLDYSGNFSISADVQQVKGKDGYGYGLLFGFKDWSNYYEFEITDNGYCQIIHVDQGISTSAGWARNANIPGKEFPCRLKIVKVNDWIGFYLEEPGDGLSNIFTNPSFVNMIRADAFAGKKIGFVTNGNISAKFDNFTVFQLGMADVTPLTDIMRSLLTGQDPETLTLFNDDFSSNVNNWKNGREDASFIMGVTDGAYSFEKLDRGGRIAKQSVFIAPGSDYQIQYKARWVSGTDSSLYGFAWGFKDWNNYQEFSIDKKGICRYLNALHGTENALTASFNPQEENRLKISRVKDSLYFYVNDVLVIKAPDSSPAGSDAGFVVYNRQKVLFDDLKITQVKAFPAEGNPIMVAEETMQKNEGTFSEDASADDVSIDWEPGMVTYEHDSDGSYAFWKHYYLNPNDDFSISEKLKWIEGDSTQGYGLIWGYRNWDNYNDFLISKNGYFMVRIFHNKNTISTGWRRFNAFAVNGENTLEVKRKGSTAEYFINGQLAAVLPFYELYGYSDGIVFYGKQTVGLENLTVKSFPVDKPEFDRGKVVFNKDFETAEVNTYSGSENRVTTYEGGKLCLSAKYPEINSYDDTDYPDNNAFYHEYPGVLPGMSSNGSPSIPFSVEAKVGLVEAYKSWGAGLNVGGIGFLVDRNGKYRIGSREPKSIDDSNLPSQRLYRLKVVYDRNGMLDFYINEKMVETMPASMSDNSASLVVYASDKTAKVWFDDLIVKAYY